MHFVIYLFIACICLITSILFTEVFPKWFKVVLMLIGSAATGYAASILVRKIAELTNAYAKPDLLIGFYIATVITFVLVVIMKLVLKKKKSK